MEAKPAIEMLEEWDWDKAVPTGRSVPRKTAHEKGTAHEGVHLWIIRTLRKEPEVLFQHRAKDKETFPDTLDITAGGHVPFGHNQGKIQKEAYEELGIYPEDKDLHYIGLYRYEERFMSFRHREFQNVYILVDNRPLDQYRFVDGEVDGIVAVRLADLEALMRKDCTFPVEGYEGGHIITHDVSRKDFHPFLFSQTMEIYMDAVIKAVKEIISHGRASTRMPSPI